MERTEHYRPVIKELLTEVAGYTPPTESVRAKHLLGSGSVELRVE